MFRSSLARISLVAGLAFALCSGVPSSAEAQRRPQRGQRSSGSIVFLGGSLYPHVVYFDTWSQWGRPMYPPYGYRAYGYPEVAAVRLQVTPRDAEVYVDGFHAGVVDEFDGIFQRLRLTPGGHDIEIYLEGYRTEIRSIYVGPRSDHRIRLTMTPLGPGEVSERPLPPDLAEAVGPESGRTGRARRDAPGVGTEPRPDARAPRDAPEAVGVIALSLQPADAEVFVDGEAWSRPAGQGTIAIQLPVGEHRIEVRREGYASYVETVLIQRGRTLEVNVTLKR